MYNTKFQRYYILSLRTRILIKRLMSENNMLRRIKVRAQIVCSLTVSQNGSRCKKNIRFYSVTRWIKGDICCTPPYWSRCNKTLTPNSSILRYVQTVLYSILTADAMSFLQNLRLGEDFKQLSQRNCGAANKQRTRLLHCLQRVQYLIASQ